MKRTIEIGCVIAWLLLATLALAYVWGRHPDAIPPPPLSFSLWLNDLFDAHDAETSADVDLYYMLIASFLFASLCTFVAWRIFKRLRTR
ncbi:hypothetical protein FAZ69_25945 [Trinickia terrae]|uniref:Uncharacterized protein n=1 Tax=Trinickia terrae TaxID=2571161 RepID=A0A4U1HRY2_9BURK|nr:hypothetical protein [Trinickia terrae]TKC83133.1 hypothetical protein FAZ69_25945 [Trinickia terrae]